MLGLGVLGVMVRLFIVCSADDSDVLAQLTVLANESVAVPCDLSTRGMNDVPELVLWYRGASPAPFYSYDLRDASGGRHWSDETVFGKRAEFDLNVNPPSLKVQPVRPGDQNTYKCRVDYQRGPSKTSNIHLAVIVPPSTPVVTDESGSVVKGSAGPYKEGGRVVLTCKTIGGRPSPTLVWLRDGRVVEDSYTVDHRGQVRNLLHLDNLSRDFLDASFTCRATNNNITQPLDNSVTINMTLAPLSISLVKVAGPQEYVSAGATEELECSSTGSRPQPTISWWRDGLGIPDPTAKQLVLPNKTISTLRLVPRPGDHGVLFTCRVQNPLLGASALEDSYKLNVHYVPQVELLMGMGLSPKSVREGSDVFFECRVVSNPKFYKITWIHEGNEIKHNVSGGVIVSNQTLVLQRVGRDRAGRYYCRATNLHGEGVSQPITITIMYAPVCSREQNLQYQVAHHETANITCRVDAVPGNVTFTWRFNSSGSLLELGEGRAASSGTTSILPYTPASPGDYGLLLCSATNSIGIQALPCVINVTATKPPELLETCDIRNQTTHSVFVTCKSVPTVLPRTFSMEVRNSEDLRLVTKVTNTTPHFVATGLDPGTAYTLHVAVHSPMGASSPISLQAFTVKTAEKRMGITEPVDEVLGVSPLVAVVAGAAAAIVITLLIIVGLAIKHCRRRHPPDRSGYGHGHPPASLVSEASPKETVSTFSRPSPASEDRNPDIIPLKEDCEYKLEELRVPSCQVMTGVPSCHQLSTLAPPASIAPPVSTPMVVGTLGRSGSSCDQPEWGEAYYQTAHQQQQHLHHHHHHHHHALHQLQPPASLSPPFPPQQACQVLSGGLPHQEHHGHGPHVSYSSQTPVSGAAYTTPVLLLAEVDSGTSSPSPHLDPRVQGGIHPPHGEHHPQVGPYPQGPPLPQGVPPPPPHAHVDYDLETFRHESSV